MNETSETDLAAAVRVQEYLADAISVGQVLSNLEYQIFVNEVNQSLFDRSRHSRYAFLGAILPLLRTAIQFIPRVINAGSTAYNVGRDIHAALREARPVRKAMLGPQKGVGHGRRAMLGGQDRV